MSVIESFLSVVFNSSASILFAALGILLMHLSGVLNIGAEGMMLIGAFSGVVGSYLTGNVWLGALFAMAMTGIVGLVYGYCTITCKANQVVTGIAFNILAIGVTTTLYRIVFGMNSSTMKVESFPRLGPLSAPVYLGFLAVIVMTVFLSKTKPGLKVRGAGEYPLAMDSMGIRVNLTRYVSVVVGAMIIGLGGAYLSLGQLSFFTENMTDGRGYIALAAVIFGRYTAIGTWLAVLVFGAGEAMTYRLQALSSGIPSQMILMIPYVLSILVVAFFGQKGSGPVALGTPFSKEDKQ